MKLKLLKTKTLKQLLEIFRKGESVVVEVEMFGRVHKWHVNISRIERDTKEMHFLIFGKVREGNSVVLTPVAWKYKLQLPSQKNTGFLYTEEDATNYKGDDNAPV